ncbi:uncharacterized protein LOC101850186 [Aplysia californica]|uniref:Uncharacterized protein LOC101850186 n=1 Tax=Aplysia californica TaxID=6500 RepID=A0ABM0JWV0_APLCA|nr:uncharacterized protein LOC101850186 [Aplysia californica]
MDTLVMVAALMTLLCATAESSETDNREEKRSRTLDLVEKFPGYFRTREEQVNFERQLRKVQLKEPAIEAQRRWSSQQFRCSYMCQRPFPFFVKTPNSARTNGYSRSKRSEGIDARMRRSTRGGGTTWMYHGCCMTRRKFHTPSVAVNADWEEKVVVQTPSHQQYFPIDVCWHAYSCRGCTCMQEYTLMSAIVENTDISEDSSEEHVIDLLRVKGCCRCMNG